jgi:hypothetical protein
MTQWLLAATSQRSYSCAGAVLQLRLATQRHGKKNKTRRGKSDHYTVSSCSVNYAVLTTVPRLLSTKRGPRLTATACGMMRRWAVAWRGVAAGRCGGRGGVLASINVGE